MGEGRSTGESGPFIEVYRRDFVPRPRQDASVALRCAHDAPTDHNYNTDEGSEAQDGPHGKANGRLVDAVSHSTYWKSTAIFVVEDDAQAGPDHVDAHRTIAQVISPYTQTGKVDSTFYSTVSMLRTMSSSWALSR